MKKVFTSSIFLLFGILFGVMMNVCDKKGVDANANGNLQTLQKVVIDGDLDTSGIDISPYFSTEPPLCQVYFRYETGLLSDDQEYKIDPEQKRVKLRSYSATPVPVRIVLVY